jgi:glycosyltransferase involved in cell wall biosynthesis
MAKISQPVVEVRIPTYKRPQMLGECLDSLLAQTWTDWRAIVFDDSSSREAKPVVEMRGDSRIHYRANPVRFGAAANLNQCFRTASLLPGSTFAFCLEDDNWLYPHAIAANIKIISESGCSIMMRNQDIINRNKAELSPSGETTLGNWFSRTGPVSPLELYARTVFFTGISNGALFWRTDANSNLQDRHEVIDSSLQEYIRCWQISDPVYVALEPAAAYSNPSNITNRYYTKDKSFSRALQNYHERLFVLYGDSFLDLVLALACEYNLQLFALKTLSNLANFKVLYSLVKRGAAPSPRFFLTGAIKKAVVRSPLSLT